MRSLVIGADGFVGRWLVRHLVESGDEVDAVVGPRFRPPLDGVERVHSADVRDYDEVARAVAAAEPEVVYFLAAVSEAGGRERIEDAARIGLVGAIHALTAYAATGRRGRFLLASSAHVYGPTDGRPLEEAAPLQPSSVYGAAKVAAERALLALAPLTDVEVVVARGFNHIGPGQASSFLVPSLVEQVRSIPPGGRGRIRVGLPSMVRDFTDVRDVARAYRLLAVDGAGGEVYNVASGDGRSIEEIVRLLGEVAGVELEIEVEPSRARSGEPSVLVGDAAKLRGLGWAPRHSIRETLADVLGRSPGP